MTTNSQTNSQTNSHGSGPTATDGGAHRIERRRFPARDGFELAGDLYRPAPGLDRGRMVVISSATAVPRRYYRHLARRLTEAGYTALTYDYRGIGASRPSSLRGFDASMRDWGLLDMAGAVEWARAELAPERLFLIGHSVGGQIAGLLDARASALVDGMITFSAQSGYWRLQGAGQKAAVFVHVHVSLPLLGTVFGYVPWSKLGSAEDLPKGVALEWSRWCRNPRYLLGDPSLPLERYARFEAPVLAYSFGDDTWGTPRAVDAMMRAYPNLERRHIEPGDAGLRSIGHFGFFRPDAAHLWDEPIAWLDDRA